MRLTLLSFLSVFLSVFAAFAQSDTTQSLRFSGYGEVYHSYDFANPANQEKPNFLYNHKRHNEFNVNLLLAKANYATANTRANLGVMAGGYAQYNLSNEPTWASFVYEANMGAKLSKKHNLWLDAGIVTSHIGFESAISADCWTLTRSILAENSPYYETGLKLSYTNKKENLTVAALVLNGWQRIQRPAGIQRPSFGAQITYKPTDKLTLNYSNFLGTEKPDSLQARRLFHNLYAQYEPTQKFGFIAGFDSGTDKYDADTYGHWFSPVLIARYTINKKMKVAARAEYYNDKNQIIITTNTPKRLSSMGRFYQF